jgi:low affinity Fe/Cu permease
MVDKIKGQIVLKHEEMESEIHIIHNKIGIIETILDRLENNHLTHIEKDMDRISGDVKEVNGRMWGLVIVGIVQLCAICGSLFVLVMNS